MTDERLLEELRAATEGLTYMSESDYPFEVFRWEAEPTPESLRALAGAAEGAAVETRAPADFFRAPATESGFQKAQRLLEENLSDLRVYRVGEINIPVYVVGRSASGAWLGVSTRVVET